MYYVPDNEKKQYDYVTYPRQFITYRWYKPLFTAVLFAIFYAALLIIMVVGASVLGNYELGLRPEEFLESLTGGYDNVDMTSVTGVVIFLGQVVVMLPALMLARAIVRDRTWSSYSSSRGGFDLGLFIKCTLISLVVVSAPIFARDWFFTEHGAPDMGVSPLVLALIVVLGTLQCIAEEYVFRGLLVQTLGSWLRIPIIAIIVSAVPFALMHPYNNIGKALIFITGCTLGIAAWLGRGLEASSAFHIGNNLIIFLMQAFGVTQVGSEVTMEDVYFCLAIYAVYTLIILILSKKTHWFDKVRKNDAEIFNSKISAKKAARTQKRARKKGGSAATAPEPVNVYTAAASANANANVNAASGSADAADAANAQASQPIGAETTSRASSAPRRSGRSGSYQGKHFKH